MTTRKRITAKYSNAMGGGSTPTFGTVGIGPDFGGIDGDRYNVGVNTSMPNIALFHNKSIGVQHQMTGLALNYNPQTIGVHQSGSVLGAPFFMDLQSTAATTASATIVVNTPGPPAAGDLLVAGVGCGTAGADTITGPAGWTQLHYLNSAGTVRSEGGIWYRLCDGTELSSYTWTNSSALNPMMGWIMRFRGVDQTTPINTSAQATANVQDPVAPALTTTVINCALVCACFQANTLSNTYTAPAGYTERTEQAGTIAGVSTGIGTSDTKVQAASGAVAAATMDSNSLVTSQAVSFHVAIAPGSVVIAT